MIWLPKTSSRGSLVRCLGYILSLSPPPCPWPVYECAAFPGKIVPTSEPACLPKMRS